MLKLMYDGREFRLSDGRKVNLADANICVKSIDSYQRIYTLQTLYNLEVTVNGRYTGQPRAFTSEFEFELWRNSLKSSGLYIVNNNRIELLLKGEKVQIRITNIGLSMSESIKVDSLVSSAIMNIPTLPPTLEVEFTVPMYKENQCI